jgi:hypothetical protein
MSVRIGSLLIEVASGVARVESDMGKISKILSGHTQAWQKMFQTLKIVASGWLAKKVLDEGFAAMVRFGDAGMKGAEKLGVYSDKVKEFRERQSGLNDAFERFAGEVIGPVLPKLNDLLLVTTDIVNKSAKWYWWLSRIGDAMVGTVPSWAPFIGVVADGWRKGTQEVSAYAAGLREVERAQKAVNESFEEYAARALTQTLSESEEFEADQKVVQEMRKDAAEAERIAEAARIEQQLAQTVEYEAEQQRIRQESDEALDRYTEERDALVTRNMFQTEAGRRALMDQSRQAELRIAGNDANQRLAIERRYSAMERQETQRRVATKMSIMSEGANAMTSLMGAVLGENSKTTQKFAIFEALVNTYAGVTMALRFLKPPESWIAAAQSLAMGMKQVKAIKSASPGGSGSSGSIGGGVPTTGQSIPEPMAEPATSAPRTERGHVEIHIANMIGDRTWVANNLVPLLEDLHRDRGWSVGVAA